MEKENTVEQVSDFTVDEIQEWITDGLCPATDGCIVEPDGVCPHGCQSWLLELGLI